MNNYPVYVIYSAVQTEVITLAEAKSAIKLDSTSFSENITITSSVTAGYYSVTATATGSGIAINNKKCLAILEPFNLSSGATLDVKLQESLDNVTYTDVDSGSFTQVTTANDTVIQKKEYTGDYSYLRSVYTIAGADAGFSLNMILSEATSIEDDEIEEMITTAREYAEEFTNRAIGEQKWKLLLDEFPDNDYIELQFPPLISVNSVTYIDSDGISATMSASCSDGYIVDVNKEPGRIFLAYNSIWPIFTELPYNAIEIIFTCGYTSDNVPKKIKQAMLKMIGALYENRQSGIQKEDMESIDNLLRGVRIINVG